MKFTKVIKSEYRKDDNVIENIDHLIHDLNMLKEHIFDLNTPNDPVFVQGIKEVSILIDQMLKHNW